MWRSVQKRLKNRRSGDLRKHGWAFMYCSKKVHLSSSVVVVKSS